MRFTARLVGFESIGRDLAGTVTEVLLQVFLVAGHAPAPPGVLQVR